MKQISVTIVYGVRLQVITFLIKQRELKLSNSKHCNRTQKRIYTNSNEFNLTCGLYQRTLCYFATDNGQRLCQNYLEH